MQCIYQKSLVILIKISNQFFFFQITTNYRKDTFETQILAGVYCQENGTCYAFAACSAYFNIIMRIYGSRPLVVLHVTMKMVNLLMNQLKNLKIIFIMELNIIIQQKYLLKMLFLLSSIFQQAKKDGIQLQMVVY